MLFERLLPSAKAELSRIPYPFPSNTFLKFSFSVKTIATHFHPRAQSYVHRPNYGGVRGDPTFCTTGPSPDVMRGCCICTPAAFDDALAPSLVWHGRRQR